MINDSTSKSLDCASTFCIALDNHHSHLIIFLHNTKWQFLVYVPQGQLSLPSLRVGK